MKNKLIVAVSGASGSIYAKVLFDKLKLLKNQFDNISMVMSNNAKDVWEYELGNKDYEVLPFENFSKTDFMAPFASGSAAYNKMIVCPCSMGLLGRIAAGVSDDLITRAADVILKERRQLILITRETPLNLIHINNMKIVTEAGAIICPASPSFYSKPQNAEEIAATVIDRVLSLCDLDFNSYQWGENA